MQSFVTILVIKILWGKSREARSATFGLSLRFPEMMKEISVLPTRTGIHC